MTATVLAVAYRLRVPVEDFRKHATEAAASIAQAPGLVWKLWALDEAAGEGTSLYLFRDAASAEAFADGPAIASLRSGPASAVHVRIASVVADLSMITRAGPALAAAA